MSSICLHCIHLCKNLLVSFFALGLVCVLPAQARSLSEIIKSKELRICISFLHPALGTAEPTSCRENCKISGAVYEESLAFTRSLGRGIQPRFLRVNWDEQFFNKEGKTVREGTYTPELLASGQCDLYPSNLTKNEWRLKKMDFVMLFPSRMMVIVNNWKKPLFKNSMDLAGKFVAVEKDTSFHTWLEQQNELVHIDNPILIKLMNSADSLAAVDAGKVDFTLLDSDMAMWSARHQLKNATVTFPVGTTDEIGWAFRKEDKDLQSAAQKFLNSQRKDANSELNKIWKNHFGRTLTEFIALMMSVK